MLNQKIPSYTGGQELRLDHPAIAAALVEAGDIALRYYGKSADEMGLERKGDSSPVTRADKEASEHITRRLKEITQDVPVFSEEDFDDATKHLHRLPAGYAWYIDPIDGTEAFVSGDGKRRFAVHAMLMKDGEAVAGYIYSPLDRKLYYGRCEDAHREAYSAAIDEKHVLTHIKPLSAPRLREDGATYFVHNEKEPFSSLNQARMDGIAAEKKKALRVKYLTPALMAMAMFDPDALEVPADAKNLVAVRLRGNSPWDLPQDPIIRAAGGSVSRLDGSPVFPLENGVEAPFNVISTSARPYPLHAPARLAALALRERWQKWVRESSELQQALRDNPAAARQADALLDQISGMQDESTQQAARARLMSKGPDGGAAMADALIASAEGNKPLLLAAHRLKAELTVNGLIHSAARVQGRD